MGDGWKTQMELEGAKMKMLMDDFDSGLFLDETGDFKYTNPDVNAVIRCDDINHLGNASQKHLHDHPETVHGFNTEDLIELQNIKLTDDTPEPTEIQALGHCVSPNLPVPQRQSEEETGSPAHTHKERTNEANSFRGPRWQTRYPQQQQGQRIPNNPPVSQSRNEEQSRHPEHTHKEHRYKTNIPGRGQQTRYHHQRQGYGIPNCPPPQFQMQYWSPTRPPPPPSNQYMFPPNVNPQLRFGYPHNGAFLNDQMHSRAFNPQNFHRRTRPSFQSFHSRNAGPHGRMDKNECS